jgi:hypothetical protein
MPNEKSGPSSKIDLTKKLLAAATVLILNLTLFGMYEGHGSMSWLETLVWNGFLFSALAVVFHNSHCFVSRRTDKMWIGTVGGDSPGPRMTPMQALIFPAAVCIPLFWAVVQSY